MVLITWIVMDINNQMILMRKDMKKAKNFVIFKLVRRIRTLKGKNGNSQQLKKNNERAERLGREIEILKEIKPDVIFKFLLSFNLTDHQSEDITKLNLSLNDRVCVRVGLLPFIKNSMQIIRKKVCDFNKFRSEKDTIASFEVMKTYNTQKETSEKKRANRERTSPKIMQSARAIDECGSQDSSLPSEETIKPTCQPPAPITSSNSDINIKSLTSKSNDSFNSEQAEQQLNEIQSTKVNILSSELNKREVEHHTSGRRKYDFTSSKSTDVSKILENLGQGYADSDDETPNSFNNSNASCNDEHDFFFIDETSNDVEKLKQCSQKVVTSVDEDDKLSSVHSTFVENLSGGKSTFANKTTIKSNKKGKKRNRIGQRERRQLYGNHSNADKIQTKISTKQFQTNKLSESSENIGKPEVSLHPSWQASKIRKMQNVIHEYQGNHVRFEDSD